MQRELDDVIRDIREDSPDRARQRAHHAFDAFIEGRENRVVLFGCGSMGRRTLACLRRAGIQPAAFSDNNTSAWGKTIDDVRVLSPIEAASEFGSTGAFIVTVYNYSSAFEDVKKQLLELGCMRVTSVIPFRWKYQDEFLPYFRDDLPEKVHNDIHGILRVADLWADPSSRDLFLRQVHWRMFGDFGVLDPPDPQPQYFPPDLVTLSEKESFVDCGAFNGDSIRSFLAACDGRFERAHAVEPDPGNLEALHAYLNSLPVQQNKRIETHAVAVGSTNSVVRFAAGRGVSSAIDGAGPLEVPCRRLDDLLAGEHVTHLKLDVEGAEPDALIGASQTIEQQRPRLSVCVYHAQNHLWRIPLWIAEHFPDYRLFLRSHQPDCWDTVAYALQPTSSNAWKAM